MGKATAFDALAKARLHAKTFMRTDPDTREVYYLPGGADPRVVRLLVVSDAVRWQQTTPLGFLELFMGYDEEQKYTVQVADVSPAQFEQVERGRLKLPPGWELVGKVRLPDRRPRPRAGA